METATHGQISASAAEVYEAFFVPSLFAEWAPQVAEAASLRPGDAVLDVACGTGVLARRCLAGAAGDVTGLDRNPDMLAVARTIEPKIHWHEGMAEALPFADARFDTVVSQFGLMFFEDRTRALSEMWRVLKPGGRLAVAVWDCVANAPGYAAMTRLLDRLFGAQYADALRAPYCLGEVSDLSGLFAAAGIGDARIETREGSAHFPSLSAWVHTDVKGWTLADMIDDAQYAALQAAAETDLRDFVQADGTVSFRHPAHIVTASKP